MINVFVDFFFFFIKKLDCPVELLYRPNMLTGAQGISAPSEIPKNFSVSLNDGETHVSPLAW